MSRVGPVGRSPVSVDDVRRTDVRSGRQRAGGRHPSVRTGSGRAARRGRHSPPIYLPQDDADQAGLIPVWSGVQARRCRPRRGLQSQQAVLRSSDLQRGPIRCLGDAQAQGTGQAVHEGVAGEAREKDCAVGARVWFPAEEEAER